ncbi:glycosyltransferase family 2 protein [Entomospira culicis]|uniref:Glycosyltransferase n=1 Tax=Entomospira culicis TaxID=2719989 RepID=A0A968KVG7_9SPIO|nr:glycosyltransferase [Entomospira culicis]NIZ19913.1 glycosyltransferase [Entomospira culicis]NIZ70130.1 glycosyltransferase [Entomospira culicis]WDI38057.1 glycosyltransferase [Entomospira culicis]WDI39680.1 glycosyltransferase [Entomospira culicis]
MLVSIIVPFYNVEPYFRRCLDSIINQSYQNLEIILINDCSPDNSIDIAREYAQKDSRIQIIEHEKSLHVGGARNSGMAVAKGEYLWFIDSDDAIATPYAVEHLVSIAQRDDSDIILFNAQSLTEDGILHPLYHFYSYAHEQIFNEKNSFYTALSKTLYHAKREYGYFGPEVWSKLFRVHFLKQHNFLFLEHTVHQDIPSLILFPLAKKVSVSPYVYYNYYQREGSTMHSQPPSDYLDHFARIFDDMWEISDKYLFTKQEDNVFVVALFMPTLLYNIPRIAPLLTESERAFYYLRIYDFLKKYLLARLVLKNFESWPLVIGYSEFWQDLFKSFTEDISDIEKRRIVHILFYPRLEQERLEQEHLEQERLEQERLEQERLEQERLEQERLEQERLEQERLEQERLEQERLEQERLEQERLEQERLEQERLEQERLEQERLEQELIARQFSWSKVFRRLRKVIKMLLPHGIIRFIQIQKSKERK